MTDTNRAGGIVFRRNKGNVEYLLVGPKKENTGTRNEWLFPKGHIEKGELPAEAALREVREEAGVIARSMCLVGHSEYDLSSDKPATPGPEKSKDDFSEKVVVEFYLLESLGETAREEKRRKKWFSYERALKQLTHEENRRLLREAERQRGMNLSAASNERS